MNLVKMIFLLLILTSFVAAQEFPSPQDKYVNDFAGFFNESEISYMRGILQGLESETTAEVVVVTVNSTEPLTPQEYRTKLFEEWQIGKADKDNGLLILYSVNENRIEVETGYGLEGILPDSKLGRFLDDYYVPLRDIGKPNEGIIAFVEIASNEIYLNKEEVISGQTVSSSEIVFGFVILIIIFLIFVAIIYSLAKNKRNGFRRAGWMIAGGGFGGGSSGGGFGSFGGGGSGGGGVGR